MFVRRGVPIKERAVRQCKGISVVGAMMKLAPGKMVACRTLLPSAAAARAKGMMTSRLMHHHHHHRM